MMVLTAEYYQFIYMYLLSTTWLPTLEQSKNLGPFDIFWKFGLSRNGWKYSRNLEITVHTFSPIKLMCYKVVQKLGTVLE